MLNFVREKYIIFGIISIIFVAGLILFAGEPYILGESQRNFTAQVSSDACDNKEFGFSSSPKFYCFGWSFSGCEDKWGAKLIDEAKQKCLEDLDSQCGSQNCSLIQQGIIDNVYPPKIICLLEGLTLYPGGSWGKMVGFQFSCTTVKEALVSCHNDCEPVNY